MELQEALDQFLLLDRAKSTRDTYRKVLSRFVSDVGPGRPLELVQPGDVNAYILKLRDRDQKWGTHPTRPQVNEPLSSATVYKHTKTIKRFFNWCIEKEYIDLSPARDVSNKRPALLLGEGKAATEEEVIACLLHARRKPRDWAIMLLLAESGARASEIATLRIRNLALADNQAIIDGKGSKRRTLYFLSDASAAIAAWLAVRPTDATHNYVFTSTRGHGRMLPQAISQITRRLSRAAGLERSLGAHAFRHYVGTKLARERVPLPVIQAWLGHSDPSITLQYQRSLNNDDIRAAGNALALAPLSDAEILRKLRRFVV